jgi:asparagine N-glycosylation enzyme membrane subunit Stt3
MDNHFQLSQRSWNELLATLVWIVLPHLFRLPVWVSIIFVFSIGWRYLSIYKGFLLPPRYLRNALAILCIILIYVTFQRVSGKEAGVAFLVSLMGLKLLEMKSLREALLLVFLSYFLMLTHFLYSQNMLTVLYLISAAILSTATLIGFQHTQFSQKDSFNIFFLY